VAASGSGGGIGSGAIRAGRAFVEIFANDSELAKGLESAKRRVQTFGLKLAGIGAGAASGAAGILSGGGWKSLDTLGDASRLSATAQAFGITAESASRIFGIMGSAGSDIRDATEGIVTLGQRVTDAIGGKGQEAVELFQQLGIGADQFAGLKPDQQFYKLLESLRAVADPAKRVQLLLKSVGEDTGKNLIPLLGKSAGEIQELGKRFEISAADMKAAEKATAAYSLAVADVSGAWRQVATALAPAIAQVAGAISSAARPVGQFLSQNRELVLVAATAAAGVGAMGAAMVAAGLVITGTATVLGMLVSAVRLLVSAVGLVPRMLVSAVGLLVSAVGLVTSPVGLAAVAVAGLTALFVTQTATGKELVGNLSATFGELLGAVREAWGGIAAALRAGDLKLAGEVAMAGLNVAWEVGIAGLRKAWRDFSYSLADTLVGAFGQVKQQYRTLTTGVAAVLVDVLEGVGIYSGDYAKGVVKNLWKENDAEQKKAATELAKLRADMATDRAAASAAAIAAGNPALDAAKQRLADAVKQAGEAEVKAKGAGVAVNQPNGQAPFVSSGVRGAFGTSLANQLGTGAQPWVVAQLKAAKNLVDINQKMDRLIDATRDRKAVFA
jgi:hypothetical protein